jgi:hypothetical protein
VRYERVCGLVIEVVVNGLSKAIATVAVFPLERTRPASTILAVSWVCVVLTVWTNLD